MKQQRILYIHGFNSSPQSMKSAVTKEYLSNNHSNVAFHCPQLATSPNAAIHQLEQILAAHPEDHWQLMGSSLGGYFSSYLAEKYQLKAVLINPAIRPFELLSDYIGAQKNPYTEEVYQVTEAHILDLQNLYNKKISQKHYMVMVQTGDEVLDYQQAVDKYHQSQLIVQQSGDHSFIDYPIMLPAIMSFFDLQPSDNN